MDNELYFRVEYGFEKSKSIPIKGNEVQKAIMAMLLKTPVQIGDSVVNGSHIMSIREDWNKALGINPTWDLQSDDWNEIRNKSWTYHIKALFLLKKKSLNF